MDQSNHKRYDRNMIPTIMPSHFTIFLPWIMICEHIHHTILHVSFIVCLFSAILFFQMLALLNLSNNLTIRILSIFRSPSLFWPPTRSWHASDVISWDLLRSKCRNGSPVKRNTRLSSDTNGFASWTSFGEYIGCFRGAWLLGYALLEFAHVRNSNFTL